MSKSTDDRFSVSSVKTLEDVKGDPNCLYLSMPVQVSIRLASPTPSVIGLLLTIQQFETLGGFKQFAEVLQVGLVASREALQKWKSEGRLPTGLVDDIKGATAIKRGNRLRWVRLSSSGYAMLII